ncbi:hypothetical protein CJF42_25435 [Pseudoalteromonas sp. NBT06-2]|uniref:hypothetical protein n=1 Tax=Pseudoalteromonas sp. NBT06-2 TaxID=2025950 RepID=UPI000BA74621|nr:hypothetical protein [Pseudoalteromonas sp. NBT06-2]PAJ71678.1 hypothetical protein CJF42_25435 [Pseudoalteromonas sp. NBT06-2]
MTLQQQILKPRMIFISHYDKHTICARITSIKMGLKANQKWDSELCNMQEMTFLVPSNKPQWQKLHRRLRMLFSPFTYETLYEMFEPNPFFCDKKDHIS